MSRERIVETAKSVLRGELGLVTEPGYCLQAARVIVEKAMSVPPRTLYNLARPYLHRKPGENIRLHWARGMERALRALGVGTHFPKPGDLLFSWKVSRPYGHVAVMVDEGFVLENTTANRGWRTPWSGAIRLTPLQRNGEWIWDPVTFVADGARLGVLLVQEAARRKRRV